MGDGRAAGKRRRSARWIVAALLAAAVLLFGRPLAHLARVALRERAWPEAPALAADVRDDASHLEPTRVTRVVRVPADEGAALAAIRGALDEARAQGLPVTIAGARHTMGGHTLSEAAIVLDMLDCNGMELDPDGRTLRVQGGARWHEILPFLDARGLSVGVMQSNDVFSVGGSLSANCHGWQPGHAPIASTVRALRVVTADGRLVRCSRAEEDELFGLVLGGYGLFGVILEAELATVPNRLYRTERLVLPVADYVATLRERALAAPDEVGLAFGRLSVAPDTFLAEAVLTLFHVEEGAPPPLVPDPAGAGRALKRLIFRASVGSAYGKDLRWELEKRFGGRALGESVSRNALLHDDLSVIENRDPEATEILQEYFVPQAAFPAFVADLGAAVRAHECDLLNVTVRDLSADEDAFLRYANRELVALVLLFHQGRDAGADRAMEPLTRALVDAALRHGGRYYLPYRLHASPEQFRAAYPMAPRFFELKRRYDPGELFRNRFYETYGR